MKALMTMAATTTAVFLIQVLQAQSFTSYLTGSAEDVDVQPTFGLCLMGGAGESDQAMAWFLERANGGDVVVIRTSGSDGYNDYLYTDLGFTLNSVETIVFNSAEASNDPYVVERLNNAEAIWMAGGNQATYVEYWKDTPVQEAINNLINVKGGPLGGISAGMAVMGQGYFPAFGGSVTSESALSNPFSPSMDFGYDDFIDAPFMENVITETHLNDPTRIRYGRITAFMARMGYDQDIRPLGMASNEFCAIAIDQNGLARAFGEFPSFDDDYVYFLQENCIGPSAPEVMEAGLPITWLRDQEAVKVYRLPATGSGLNTFDLLTWNAGEGGTWENWYVEEGELERVTEASATACFLSVRALSGVEVSVFPNPTSEVLTVRASTTDWDYQVLDISGRMLLNGSAQQTEQRIQVNSLSTGIYKIVIRSESAFFSASFVKL
jgi:cyanophycinase-like exopeptidase